MYRLEITLQGITPCYKRSNIGEIATANMVTEYLYSVPVYRRQHSSTVKKQVLKMKNHQVWTEGCIRY